MTYQKSMKYTTPVIKKNQPDDSYKFRALPPPTGSYPYHLKLQDVRPLVDGKQVFHMVGDTGSVLNTDFQKIVAQLMIRQFEEAVNEDDKPQFLYHLGDLVYKFGEAEEYEGQFFSSYNRYPAPIFAIAGNHDGDVNPDNPIPYNSLDAFKSVFCDSARRNVGFAGKMSSLSMIQPNIYWTLESPLATIIGLYSNIPKYGMISQEQRRWFTEELKWANRERQGKAIIVCLHHAPFSADINHSSSLTMIRFLEDAFEETGVRPDIVFSGHVHNYQRFEKRFADGTSIPFIVAGGGGYDELHSIASTDDENYTNDHPLLKDVSLKAYCDSKHGFLKMTITRKNGSLAINGEYYSVPHNGLQEKGFTPKREDHFELVI